ncbi:MAG: 3-hydroxyacyl-CoA dehydrogenase/enoyl-CoA hydratase family protein [Thermomicrobia bacterium]|nr:3-hydroxyacyl-CoA dehydrogenase/enoyl-CoA hydratase family protein [Thermomicrobia bacterium]
MSETIRRVAVLGAGTMGAAIAGYCANAGLRVTLLDIAPDALTPDEKKQGRTLESRAVRDRIVRAGFERMVTSRPASLYSATVAERITLGNFTDDFAAIGEADWIIEVVIEQLAAKQALMARIEAARAPGSIVTSNTSGIPLHQIAAGRSEEFRRHFLGTHFFNPPRYMKLLEIIPTTETDPAVVAQMRRFAERTLGKGTVLCKDTPNFIANRIGTYSGMTGMRYALDHGFSIEEVDALTGPLIGRPRTASFRLADLAGVDIMVAVAENLYDLVPDDESRDDYRVPELVKRMVGAGLRGNKTGAGFYKRVDGPGGKREFHVIDFDRLDYHPPQEPEIPFLKEAGAIRDLGARLRFIMDGADAGDRHAQLVEATIVPTLAYTARRVPEISDTITGIDDAMRWGFAQERGPFETWDLLGVAETVARMERRGIAVASWVKEMLATGHPTFYRQENGQAEAYSPITKRYEPIPHDPQTIDLAALKAAAKEIEGSKGASLLDLGDGVLCFELRSKANTVGQEAMRLLDRALTLLAGDDAWRAMVIGNQGDYFSAGVDVREIGGIAQANPSALAGLLAAGHQVLQRLRFSLKPVVAAPFGNTLGLGVELALASAGICTEGETYMGLVEVSVGLIPGGGGCKELVRRIVSPAMRVAGADPLPYLRRIVETIGQAKVSTSAIEARELGYLSDTDRIILGRDRLLMEAKRMALDLAVDYQPPLPAKNCYAAGQGALAALLVGVHQYRAGGFLSVHDATILREIATVVCGGNLSAPQWVDEAYFLRLEREAFLRLLANHKTQARITHFLETGKPLRN